MRSSIPLLSLRRDAVTTLDLEPPAPTTPPPAPSIRILVDERMPPGTFALVTDAALERAFEQAAVAALGEP